MERKYVIGIEPNEINHMYLQAKAANDFTKLYIRYNDGYVQSLTPEEMGATPEEFVKAIQTFFKEAKVSNVRGRDFNVALENADIFAELDSKIAEQEKAKESEYNFELDLDEGLNVDNVRVADVETFDDADYAIEEPVVAEEVATDAVVEDNADVELDREIADFAESDNAAAKKSANGITKAQIAVGAGIVGLAIAIGACSIIKNKDLDNEAEIVTEINDENTDTVTNTVEKVSLEGQDFAYYVELAPESYQKDEMVKYNDYAMSFNRSEDWMYQELTPEMIEELEKSGITVDGTEAIFGFTAEELHALNLVYGTHTNDQYVTLMNGKQIDITKVMSSSESEMNGAIRNAIVYYLNSDNAHLGIERVVNFTEDEAAQINRFEDMLQEYKDLMKAGSDKEAEAKMKDIKIAFLEYAHAEDIDTNNAKPWLERTLLPACSVISTSLQYMDTITLNLYDAQTNTYVDKEVKTWLFDEITMRDLVEGYNECVGDDGVVYADGFSEVEFLKSFNISTDRYQLVISDNGVSRADEYIGGLENKLESYNDYAEKLEEKNLTSDAAYLGGGGDANNSEYLNNNSEFDTLTEATYNAEEVLELIDNNLKAENKYPKNLNFFTSIYSKFNKWVMEIKDAMYAKLHGTGTKSGANNEQIVKIIPGSKIWVPGSRTTIERTITWTEETVTTETRTEKVSEEEKNKEAQEKAKKAKQIEVIDKETGEKKTISDQELIDSIANGEDKYDVVDKDNENTKKLIEAGEEDREAKKKWEEDKKKDEEIAKEHRTGENGEDIYVIGGDEHIEEEYQNADTVSEDEAEEYNRRLREQQAQQQSTNNTPNAPAPAPQQVSEQPANGVEAGTGEYTTQDPTQSDTFAPVYEEPAVLNSASFAPAYEAEINSIVESLAQEAPAQEASEGITR